MQLLEAPSKNLPLAPPANPLPEEQMRSTIELARNLTPEAKRILMDVARKNSKVAEITIQTADRLH